MNKTLLVEMALLLNEVKEADEAAVNQVLAMGVDCIDFTLINKVKEILARPEVAGLLGLSLASIKLTEAEKAEFERLASWQKQSQQTSIELTACPEVAKLVEVGK